MYNQLYLEKRIMAHVLTEYIEVRSGAVRI